jgi:hypothetical protein
VAHVLLYNGTASKLASIEYVPGGSGSYRLWTGRPALTNVTLASGVETATMDLDSTGRMWVVSDANSTIEARYSDSPYTSFSAPITLATGVTADDISAVVTMPGRIGVMWSNQSSKRFGFRTHVDGASPTTWTADEVPAGSVARNNDGGGMADDHMHLAVAGDGTVYAAVKTSYESTNATSLGLLIRRPNGAWDQRLYHVDIEGTRPTLALTADGSRLFYFFRSDFDSQPIVYKESSTAVIDFGPDEHTLIAASSINDPSTTKDRFDGELVVIASSSTKVYGARFTPAEGPPTGSSLLVSAGPDQSTLPGETLALPGSVITNPPAPYTASWTQVSGPGTALFADAAAPSTTVSFNLPGSYVLRLTADDGQQTASDETTIDVVDPQATIDVAFQDGVFPSPSYAGSRDTRLVSGNPTRNYGTATSLLADGSPDQSILLQWDVTAVPSGSTVEEASLTVYINDKSAQAYEIYEVRRAWTESQATWNLASSGTPWQAAGAQGTQDRGSTVLGTILATASGARTFALNAAGLALVQQWIDDPSSNHGLVVQDYVAATDSLGFTSSESGTASKRPRLNLSYRPAAPAPAPPLALAPTGGGDAPLLLALADEPEPAAAGPSLDQAAPPPEPAAGATTESLNEQARRARRRVAENLAARDQALAHWR